jgi:glycosyltransferase involved in cell wall biosynthesis
MLPLRVLFATDAWVPRRFGIPTLITHWTAELEHGGDVVEVIGPDRFETQSTSFDPNLQIAIKPERTIGPMIDAFRPDAIHVATEGPVGVAARNWCLQHKLCFTTSYLMMLPEYVQLRLGLPKEPIYQRLRQFHAPATRVLAPTRSMAELLAGKGFHNLQVVEFGVDTGFFRPDRHRSLDLPRPIHLCVARLNRDKNLEALLDLKLAGSTVLVGDGPLEAELRRRYPAAHFLGYREGVELADIYASADVFAFPSRTDTFGLAVLEALASGTPVAAYPVPGPKDIVGESGAGALDEDLGKAIAVALTIPRDRARSRALTFSWPRSAARFRSFLAPLSNAST